MPRDQGSVGARCRGCDIENRSGGFAAMCVRRSENAVNESNRYQQALAYAPVTCSLSEGSRR